MSKRIALVFSFFVTAAVHGFASGDVPGEIAFQGFLTDSEGAPVNGNMEMGFDLFDSDSGGESLGWSENQEVSVSDGLFNLFLGAVNPINPLIFDGKSLYLEVKVNGEVMDSRLEIASTAYCFTAQTALNVPTAEDIKVVCYDEENELVAVLDDNYAPLVHDHSTLYYSKSENDTKLAGKSDAGHQHDDLYYQKGYIDGQFVLKSDVGHAHDDLYYGKTYMDNALSEKSNTGHNHDDIYFTETETTTFLNGKADMVHAHDASDIASGTLADGRLSTNVSLLGQMIESAEIGDGEILFEHLNQNLCLDGQVIKWSDENNAWECGNDETASGGSGGVTSVTASAPLSVANGTTTPHIALDKAAVQGWAQETCFDVEGELTALLDNNYASTTHNHDLLYALIGHDHNAAYYLKGDVDAKLAVKSDLGHLHDDLYYQKSYVDAALSGKSDTGHNHDSTYVNAGEFGSVTSAMVTNETLLFEDIGANGCGANQVMKRKSDNSGWECANDSMRTQTEVENWAKGVCYDGEGELTALLNDNYAAAAHTHVAADITSGTLDNARLSSSVSLLGQGIDSNEITDGTIMNNDVASNAAILYGKLNLFGSITNSDVSTTAGIGYGKLNLFSSIVDSDISGAANISDTKLATISTAGKVADSALSSNVSKFGSSVNLDSSETTGVLPVAKGGTGSSTPNFVDLSTNQTVAGNKIFSGSATFDNTITGNVSGNAGTVTNGVYTTGGYSDPVWITSLAGSKISGNISGNAANVTGVVAVANGGTGFSVPGPSGNLLRSNGVGWESWTPNFLTSEVDGVIGNEVTNAANSTLTRSGTGTSGNPYTLALNLNNANSWGAVQTFSAGANISGTLTVLGSLSLPVSGITGAGSGSGLDADKLDGQHANAFAAADHNHDTLYASIAPHQVPGTNVITTIAGDASNYYGMSTDITIGADGLPVIAYLYVNSGGTAKEMRVVKCLNPECTSSTSYKVDDANNTNVNAPSIAIGADGFPVVVHYHYGVGPRFVKCGSADCGTVSSVSTLDTSGNQPGQSPSVVIRTNGLPIVAYKEGGLNRNLRVYDCSNSSCSSGTVYNIASAGGGWDCSVGIGLDSIPRIASHVNSSNYLRFYTCANGSCSSATYNMLDSSGKVYSGIRLTYGADGLPVIAYGVSGTWGVSVVKCGNADCSSGNTITALLSGSAVFNDPWMTMSPDGYPVVAYINGPAYGSRKLYVVRCGNAACSSGNVTVQVDTSVTDVDNPSITVGVDGNPVLAYRDAVNYDLKVAKCANPWCLSGWMRK